MAGEVTTARSVYSPIFACAGAVTWKRADSDSSSWAKLSGTLAGVAFQPAGSSSATVACGRAFGAVGDRDMDLALAPASLRPLRRE